MGGRSDDRRLTLVFRCFFFSSRRRHTRFDCDWSSDVCSSDLMFPDGLHTSIWLVIPLAALLAGITGILLGIPVLKLRGDYLAIVTLGFGEIIRIFMNKIGRAHV